MVLSITIFGVTVAAPLVALGLRLLGMSLPRWEREFSKWVSECRETSKRPKPRKYTNYISIAILGMKGSGKSLLYCNLRNIPYNGKQTLIENYEPFDYKKGDGTVVHIAAGKDIGGDENLKQQFMQEFIEKKDFVIYVLDLYMYLNNDEYRRSVNADLAFIYQYRRYKQRILILLSHVDYFIGTKKDDAINGFLQRIRNSDYYQFVSKNYASTNLTQKEQLKDIENKLFP